MSNSKDFSSYTSGSEDYTQGAAVSANHVWATSAGDDKGSLWRFDRQTLDYQDENHDILDGPFTDPETLPNDRNKAQTAHYHDGYLYFFCRAPQIHLVDPDTLEYADQSWYEVIPESEFTDDFRLFEGICRYDGDAFEEPKWFFNDRANNDDSDRAVYRTDDSFNYEGRYILNDANPSLEGEHDGYDGIELWDEDNSTYMAGSITASQPGHPGLDIFELDSDSFNFLGTVTLDGDPDKTPDEGFQIGSLGEVYAGVRHPDGDNSTSRRPVVLEMDWTDLIN